MVIFALICSTLCIAAASPILYDFETWNGAGSVSVSINGNESEFIKLAYIDQDVDQDLYTVEDRQGKTFLTLQEEYLKSLNLENGEYHFYAYFAKDHHEVGNSTTMLDIDQMRLTIAISPFESLSREEIVSFRLTYGEEEIDPSHYKVEMGESNTIVTFEEGFLETLSGNENFIGYTTYKQYTYCIELNLEVAVDRTAPSESRQTDPIELFQSVQEQSPKTGSGEKNDMLPIVWLTAAGSVITLVRMKRCVRKNK